MSLLSLPTRQCIFVKPGDRLVVTTFSTPGQPARYGEQGQIVQPARIACTLPEDLRRRAGRTSPFGSTTGRSVANRVSRVRRNPAGPHYRRKTRRSTTRSRQGNQSTREHLRLPGLTEKDMADLPFLVEHADLVGLSFVKQPRRCDPLQAEPRAICTLRIHGRRAEDRNARSFEQLPNRPAGSDAPVTALAS